MKTTTMRIAFAMLALFVVTACSDATITSLEEDRIVVRSAPVTDDSTIAKEAARGCAMHGRVPEATGEYCIDEGICSVKHHVFACVEK